MSLNLRIIGSNWSRQLVCLFACSILFLSYPHAYSPEWKLALTKIRAFIHLGTEPLVPCLLVLYVTIFFFGVSMITVALISTDRFVAIRWPFLYVQFFTQGSVLSSIMCAWIFMVIFSSIPYLGAAVKPEIPTKFCFYSQYLSQAYLLAMFSLINILIIVILLFTNIYLLKQTLKHIIKIKSQVIPMAWDENSQNR